MHCTGINPEKIDFDFGPWQIPSSDRSKDEDAQFILADKRAEIVL